MAAGIASNKLLKRSQTQQEQLSTKKPLKNPVNTLSGAGRGGAWETQPTQPFCSPEPGTCIQTPLMERAHQPLTAWVGVNLGGVSDVSEQDNEALGG